MLSIDRLRAWHPFGVSTRGLLAVTVVLALMGSTLVGGLVSKAAFDEQARIDKAAAEALELRVVDYWLGALDRLEPFGTQIVDDATAWAESGSPLVSDADVVALTSVAESVADSQSRTAPAGATSAELEALFNSKWAMITGARSRFGYFVEVASAAAQAHLDAAPIADAASRQAVEAAMAALQKSDTKHESTAESLGALSDSVVAVDSAQAAAVAAQAAAAAAAAAAAKKSRVTPRAGSAAASGAPAPVCASDVFTCVNQIRSYYGLRTLSSTLNGTAQECANRLSGGAFEHTNPLPDGVRGENIARGYGSDVSVFNAWMNSPGHRANILYGSWSRMGLGFASGNNWCQQFG